MKRMILAGVLALSVSVTGLMAQKKPPTPKSQKELEALQAMSTAQDPDARIKAAEEVINKFADSDFKSVATYLMAVSYEQKGDWEKTVFWSERTLQEDPQNFQSMLMLAVGIPKRAREHDLDLEEKLVRAEKYGKSVIEILATAEKPNSQITDEQWAGAKRDMIAQAHESFAISAELRKKYDVAIAEYKLAIEGVPEVDPTTELRLARVYNITGKPDEAIAILDKVNARPDLPIQIKQYAQAERVRAIQAKGGAKPPADPATTPAPATPPAAPAAPATPKQP